MVEMNKNYLAKFKMEIKYNIDKNVKVLSANMGKLYVNGKIYVR